MAVQKPQSMPSFASIISVLSILFYCAGFLRVELELHQHKKRINALESVAEAKPPSNDPDIIKNTPGKFVIHYKLEFRARVCFVISIGQYHCQNKSLIQKKTSSK